MYIRDRYNSDKSYRLFHPMKTISLKLDEDIFKETEDILSSLKNPRNRYINEALDHYNRVQKRELLAETLKEESHLVKEHSMSVLSEFEKIELINESED